MIKGALIVAGPVRRGIEATLAWVTSGRAVIVRGPRACGKKALLSALLSLFKNQSDQAVLVIRASSLYGSKDLISRLKRACIKLDESSSSTGGHRTYKPKNGSNLVIVLDDLHLASKSLQVSINFATLNSLARVESIVANHSLLVAGTDTATDTGRRILRGRLGIRKNIPGRFGHRRRVDQAASSAGLFVGEPLLEVSSVGLGRFFRPEMIQYDA